MNTSTNKIAKVAGVSEGLIFRHFTNKQGLLNAVLDLGQQKGYDYATQIEKISDPKATILAILEIPQKMEETELSFWRLLYALKWQRFSYDRQSIERLLQRAENAFKELGYADPKAEAELIEILLDGIATCLLLKNNMEYDRILAVLKTKYNL